MNNFPITQFLLNCACMREGKFIDKNIQRWKNYLHETDNPDENADRFMNLIDDLSYSKTFYPKSKTTQFLNGLAARQFQSIYLHRKNEHNRVFTFWKYELPLLFARYHTIYFFVLVYFVLCVIIGMIATAKDPELLSHIVGSEYVEMTEDNIAKGDPFGVYKSKKELGMFLQIAVNNIQVSFMTFASGLLAGIGTLYFLFTNGVMLGSFQYFFFTKGLGWKSVLVIWIHGTLEISAIVIAGTAGMILGHALLFPGTYKRIASLKRGAKDAAKIVIGLIPIFLVAAFFEGFITRHTGMPIALSISILVLSGAFIVWYFIVYPILLKRAGVAVINGKVEFPAS